MKINREQYYKTTIKTIREVESLMDEIKDNRQYYFLNIAVSEAKIMLVNLALYLQKEHPYYPGTTFPDDYLKQIISLTHRVILHSVHIATELSFEQLLKSQEIKKRKKAGLLGYLETLLQHKPEQDRSNIRNFLKGIDLMRDKFAHSPELDGYYKLTEDEIKTIRHAKLDGFLSANSCLQFRIDAHIILLRDMKTLIDFLSI